jgi:hypothetical protein
MKTILETYKISELVSGFVYNELEGKGLFGLSGKLAIPSEKVKGTARGGRK